MKKQYVILASKEGADWANVVPISYGGLKQVLDYFSRYSKDNSLDDRKLDKPYDLTLYWLARLDDEFTVDTPIHFFFKYDKNGDYKGVKPFHSFIDLRAPVRDFGILKEYR